MSIELVDVQAYIRFFDYYEDISRGTFVKAPGVQSDTIVVIMKDGG